MNSEEKLKLIGDLMLQTEYLSYKDSKALDSLLRRGEMVIRNFFGEDNKHVKDFKNIIFYPMPTPVSMAPDEEDKRECWERGQERMLNLLSTIKEEIVLFGPISSQNQVEVNSETQTDKIFIVHGHDEGARESVARFLEKVGLEPVILHEQAGHSKTLIEKLEHYSQVRFALVVMTPDDVGGKNESALKPRARQNVVLELGYFLGLLGRSKVRALYKGNLELPSDIMGVEYIPMNDESWKLKLVRELEASGFEVNRKAI